MILFIVFISFDLESNKCFIGIESSPCIFILLSLIFRRLSIVSLTIPSIEFSIGRIQTESLSLIRLSRDDFIVF